MRSIDIQHQLDEAQHTIGELREELRQTNEGVLFLNLELEQRIEQLEASEARFEALVSTIPDIIYRIDVKGHFTFLNQSIKTMGYEPEELIGKHFSEIMLPGSEKAVSRRNVLAKYKGKVTGDENAPKLFDERRTGNRITSGLEVVLVSKGGKSKKPAVIETIGDDAVYVEINASGLYESTKKRDGKIFIGTVGVIRDITERKQREIELHNSNLELSAVNKELEAFSYSVSHDLRAPLRSIDGFSQALLEDYEDKLDEQGKEYLMRVRAATQRMGHLIDDLLDLSRITRKEMKRESVDLSALAQSVMVELHVASPERIVDFVIEPGLKAEVDASLFRVLLENLFDNAFKFTEKNPNARIKFGSTDIMGREVFFVSDNGAGFEMAYANKLFGAFQRLHSASEYPGTGIGLATVKRIIHRHGGEVWAEGKPDEGATFYFTTK